MYPEHSCVAAAGWWLCGELARAAGLLAVWWLGSSLRRAGWGGSHNVHTAACYFSGGAPPASRQLSAFSPELHRVKQHNCILHVLCMWLQVAQDIRKLSKVKPQLPWSASDTNIRKHKPAAAAAAAAGAAGAAAGKGSAGFGGKGGFAKKAAKR